MSFMFNFFIRVGMCVRCISQIENSGNLCFFSVHLYLAHIYIYLFLSQSTGIQNHIFHFFKIDYKSKQARKQIFPIYYMGPIVFKITKRLLLRMRHN